MGSITAKKIVGVEMLLFPCLQNKKKKEKTAGKGEIVRNEQLLLFPQCLLPFWRTSRNFHHLTLSQTTNFTRFQTERVCRRQSQP